MLISGILWLVGQFASLLLFWAYIIQKFILFTAYALSPLLIGFMAIRPLRSIGSRYLMHIVGVLLWPLGWAVAALITQGILDFMTDPSLRFFDPTASFYSLQATVGVAVVAFWIVFSTIAAPLVIQKVLSHGDARGRPAHLRRVQQFLPDRRHHRWRCGRRLHDRSPARHGRRGGHGRGSQHALHRRRTRQRRRDHHRRLWFAAALRSRPARRRHHRRQGRPRTHRQRQRQLLLTLMETTELRPRETPTGNGATPARLARKKFDPTQLFAQRDRLPWFWFFVAVAVSVLAAFDRYHIIDQFKQRERVVIIDPAQTYYISPLLQFPEAKDLHAQQAELATVTFLERNPKDFDHPELLRQMFLKSALQKAQDHRTREAVEFRAKQLHQKPEIAKIDILATRENEVLVAVSGQVIRTGIFQEKAFTEAFNFKLSLRLHPQPQHGCQRSFPHRCRRLQI